MSMEHIFSLQTTSDNDRKEYYDFMEKHAKELVSNIGNIRFSVPNRLVRSIVIPNGANRRLFIEFKNIMDMGQSNSNYANMHKQEICLMILHDSKGSYYKLLENMKKFIKEFNETDLQFNKVKYGYQDNFSHRGRFI